MLSPKQFFDLVKRDTSCRTGDSEDGDGEEEEEEEQEEEIVALPYLYYALSLSKKPHETYLLIVGE